MFDLERLEPIERVWEEIEQGYRLAPYNAPLNRSEERLRTLEAYQKQKPYNPQFIYEPAPSYPVQEIEAFLASLRPDRSPLEKLYLEKARHELLAIRCVAQRSPAVITEAALVIYGRPDKKLLQQAKRLLAGKAEPPTNGQPLSAKHAAQWMQGVLERAGFQGWRAIVHEPMQAQMSVHRLDKEIKIRKGSIFAPPELHRLLIHEIGVHVLRFENGVRQPIRLFHSGFPQSIDTEEGLAVYSEARAGLLSADTLRKYAGRVIAADLALTHSFSDVFFTLAPELGSEMAYDISVRAKRGFMDTAQPGSHTKDIVYLRGYLSVQSYLKAHPDHYALLFAGKFGLQHIPLVQALIEHQLLSPPQFLPDHLMGHLSDRI